MKLEELEDFHRSLDDQFSVPEEEREAAIATLEVGKYKGDDPLPFRKKKREEFDKLKGERQEVIGNVHAAQQFKKDLEAQYTPLNRAKRFFKDLFSPDAAISKPRDGPKSSQVAPGATKAPSPIPTPDELLISTPATKASTGKPKTRKPITREEMERQMVEAGQHFDLPAPSILDAYKQMPGMAEISNMTEQRNAQTLMEAQRPGAKSLIPPKGPSFSDPKQEAKFQNWYKQNFVSRGLNPNPDDPKHFYDYRGAFKAGLKPGDDGHMDSRFKLPGHPRTYVDTPEGRLNTVTGKIEGKPQPGSSIIGMDGEAIPLPDDLPTPQEDVLEVPEVHVTGTIPTPGELASQFVDDIKQTGRDIMEAPPVQSVGQGVTEAAHNFMQGLAAMPAGALKSIAIASRSLDRILPDSLKDDRPIEERGTYKLGTEIDKLAKRLFPTDPAMQKNFIVGVLPRAVGSMTGFLAGGVAGAVAKAPVTATAVLGASVGGTDQFEEAKAHKAAPDVQEKSFWLGSAVGSSEALPIAGIINRFNKATGGRFVQVLKESGVTAAQEFIQEFFQQTGNNAVAQQLYDENRSWFEGAGMGGAAGGGSGAMVGFLSGLLGARKARIRSQNQTDAQSPLFTEPVQPSVQTQVAGLPDELQVTQPEQRPPFLMKQPQAPSVPPSPVPPPDMAVHLGQEQGGRPLPVQAPTPEMVQPEPAAIQPEPVMAQPKPVTEPAPPVQAAPVLQPDPMTDDMHEAMSAELVPLDEMPVQPDAMPPTQAAPEEMTPEIALEDMRSETPLLEPETSEAVEIPDEVYARQEDGMIEPKIIETKTGKFKVQRPDGTYLTNPKTGGTEFKTEAKAKAALDGTIDVKPKKPKKAPIALPAPDDINVSDASYVPPIGRVDRIDIQKLRRKNWAQFHSPESGAPRKSFTKGPIVLNADGKVIDGTHRLREAVVRGDSEIDVVQARPDQIADDGRFIMQERQVPDEVAQAPETTVDDIHQLADAKGIPWDGDPAFADLTEETTGKRHLDELSPAQLEKMAVALEVMQPLKDVAESQQVPTPDQAVDRSAQVELPRSELPAEENAEMLLRAEKAQADLEIAGKETGRRKVFNYDVQGQGGTPEVVGLKSAAPDWYRDLTTGPRPLKRAQIDTAIQKIIKNNGVDVGVAVERVKEALLRDREFNKTPWGEDADAIARGEWPSWIERPAAKTQQVPTPDAAFLQPQEAKQKLAKKPKAEQTSIPVPPETIGSRPIIGREVTPDEAPLFSKAAQTPDAEQTTIETAPEKQPVKPVRPTPKAVKPEATPPTVEPKPVVAKQAAKPSAYALDTIDKMYRTILDDTKAVHHLRRGNKEAWARVKKIDALMKEGQTAGLDYDEAAAKIQMEDLDALADILDAQTTKKEEPIAALASPEKITELGKPGDSQRSTKATDTPSPAKELADLFKQESESYAKKKTPKVPRIPVDPIMGGESATLTDIILDLEKGTKQKVTVGKTGRNLGVYKPGSTATMIRYSGDLDTTAHEVSHALDDRYGLVKEWKGQDTSPYDTELDPFAEHTSLNGYSPTQRRAEGVAEFMRAWVVNPKAAEAAAPQFTAHMKAQIPADIQQALKTFSNQVRSWAGNSAHAKIMANVEWETPETGLLHWLSGTRTAKGPGFQLTIGDQLAKKWTDRLAPFVKALDYVKAQRGEESVLPGDDPLLLARLYMGANAKLDDIFAHGMINDRMERATPGGLTWMLEPFDRSSDKALDQDMQAAASLMIAERTLEKTAQLQRSRVSGIGAGIEEDVSVARARIEEMKKNPEQFERIKEAANRYRQWADANLRYLVGKGRLSEEQYESIKANNEQYVAMQRILEVSPGEDLALAKSGSASNQIGSVKQPIKKFKGSSKAIKNPFLSLMDATNHSVREADRNEIMKLFRDLLTNDRGLYGESQADVASVGRLAKEGEKHTIPIYVNGKKEVWQFHPDVYAALKGIGSNEYRLPLALTILPRILRATITNAPPFALRNVIRDAWHRSIVSLDQSKPWDTLKKYSKDEISKLKRSGGDQAGFYYKDTESYARAMKFAMEEAVHSTHSIVVDPSKLMTLAHKGGKGYLDLMQQSERQGRLAEYRRAFDKAKKKFGYDDYHASLYAAGQARSLIDYAVAGEWMQTINQLIPFSNAAVQGMRMTVLRAKADPSGYALRFGAYAITPSLMAYAWNYLYGDGDDLEEYRQLPAYQRDLFWNFKLGPDLWLKVPKPFENGVLSTTFERAVDYAMGNEKAFDGHVGSLARTLLPVDEASFAGPYQAIFQAAANYDFFRERPIVPRWEENLELELRSYNRASRLGQALQQAIGVDARKIDFVINQQFGYLGRYAADISDAGRKDRHGLALSSTGMVGYSPASVSLDAKKVAKIATERGLVASRAKSVERIRHVKDVGSGGKNPDAVRYGVFRKHLNEYYKAESREERDRLAALVRDEAKFLRTRWEKTPPREEATEKAWKKRAEKTKDPILDLLGLGYEPISKHPVDTLPGLEP